MKVYISADIEGLPGVEHWDEATIGQAGYAAAASRMGLQAAAACRGAANAGADEILLQDAHHSGRNIDPEVLPENVLLMRAWTDDPRCMAQELDGSYSALVLLGQHAGSGSGGNPLAHTFTLENESVELNGKPANECLVLQYTAAFYGVPLAFVSGDAETCAEAIRVNPAVRTVATKRGEGAAAVSIHPALAQRQIEEGVAEALSGDLRRYAVSLPRSFRVDIRFRQASRAYKRAFYPGVSRLDARTLRFESDDFYEVLRMFLFVGR
jgi:D-amino peptidase